MEYGEYQKQQQQQEYDTKVLPTSSDLLTQISKFFVLHLDQILEVPCNILANGALCPWSQGRRRKMFGKPFDQRSSAIPWVPGTLSPAALQNHVFRQKIQILFCHFIFFYNALASIMINITNLPCFLWWPKLLNVLFDVTSLQPDSYLAAFAWFDAENRENTRFGRLFLSTFSRGVEYGTIASWTFWNCKEANSWKPGVQFQVLQKSHCFAMTITRALAVALCGLRN